MNRPMTESERATLQLAPGSRWAGGVVVDETGVCVEVLICESHSPWLTLGVSDDGDAAWVADGDAAWVADVLAVIRAAGLDPEYAELVRLRERASALEMREEDLTLRAEDLTLRAEDLTLRAEDLTLRAEDLVMKLADVRSISTNVLGELGALQRAARNLVEAIDANVSVHKPSGNWTLSAHDVLEELEALRKLVKP